MMARDGYPFDQEFYWGAASRCAIVAQGESDVVPAGARLRVSLRAGQTARLLIDRSSTD